MADSVAWLNGEEIPYSQMRLPVWDLGVVAGAAISEMARTYRHQPFRFPDHVRRLEDSCAEIEFQNKWNTEELVEAAVKLVEKNRAAIPESEDMGIVWFVTAGANATYLGANELPGPTVGIHTFALPYQNWKDAATHGVKLQIPTRIAMPSSVLPVHRKVRNRLHWWLADRDAAAAEPGARALLQTNDGLLTETSTSAFYAVIGDVILTPRTDVLESMSRRMVEEAAAAQGIKFQSADLHVDDIQKIDHAFLSSTPSGLLPVQSINGQQMPVPELLETLLEWWQDRTGVNPLRQILASPSSAYQAR